MKTILNTNGLVVWTEKEIKARRMVESWFLTHLQECLANMNRAFTFYQCEAPLLIPRELVNSNYTEEDIFVTQVDDLVLRPETTAPSYLYALDLLNSHHKPKIRPPLVVWQHNRSARYEQDNVLKNLRLKEFYQLEFQIVFSDTTAKDYYPEIVEAMTAAASRLIGPCRNEPSDRLPSYSTETTDIILESNDMEICSISRRTDFPKEGILVIEVAFGTDRCVVNLLES